MTRNRGKLEDSDLKRLNEENRILRKKIKSLERDKSRARKSERLLSDSKAEEMSQDIQIKKEYEDKTAGIGPIKSLDQCPKCKSMDIDSFQLNIREEVKTFINCNSCSQRSKL